MTFTLSGTMITQSGTDNNLTGLEAIDGVTTISSVSNRVKIYSTSRELKVTGTLNHEPEKEILIFNDDLANQFEISSSGTYNFGSKNSLNGYEQTSTATGLMFADGAGRNTGVFQNSGTFNWNGGKIQTYASIYFNKNATTNIKNGILHFLNTSEELVRVFGSNLSVDGLTKIGSGGFLLYNQVTKFIGFQPIHADGEGTNSAQFGFIFYNNTHSNVNTIENFSGKGNKYDAGFIVDTRTNFLSRGILLNSESGSSTKISGWTAGGDARCKGYFEAKKGVVFTIFNELDEVQEAVKIWAKDYDSGNRVSRNGFDDTSDKVYSSLTLDNGQISKTYTIAIWNIENNNGHFDRRSKNSFDDFDIFLFSYLNEFKQVTLSLAGIFSLNFSDRIFIDQSITEKNVNVVMGYSEIDTNNKLYDYSKYYLFENYNGETQTLFQKDGNVLDLRDHNLILDKNAGSVFSKVDKIITIKSSIFNGNLKTTGTVTFANDEIVSGGVEDATGKTSSIILKNLIETSVYHAAHDDSPSNFYFSHTGDLNISVKGATENHKLILSRLGFQKQEIVFKTDGNFEEFAPTYAQLFDIDGTVMYQASTSNNISFDYSNSKITGTLTGDVDAPVFFDLLEQFLLTENGCKWLLENSVSQSIRYNLNFAGQFLNLPLNINIQGAGKRIQAFIGSSENPLDVTLMGSVIYNIASSSKLDEIQNEILFLKKQASLHHEISHKENHFLTRRVELDSTSQGQGFTVVKGTYNVENEGFEFDSGNEFSFRIPVDQTLFVDKIVMSSIKLKKGTVTDPSFEIWTKHSGSSEVEVEGGTYGDGYITDEDYFDGYSLIGSPLFHNKKAKGYEYIEIRVSCNGQSNCVLSIGKVEIYEHSQNIIIDGRVPTANIVQVQGTNVTNIDEFKASSTTVDLTPVTNDLTAVKAKTDLMEFVSGDIKATLDGEETSANIKKVNDVSVTNVDDFKGSGGGSVDLSSLDSKFKQITDQTDQITFTDSSVNAQLVGTQKEQLSGITFGGGLVWEAVKIESLFNPIESTTVSKDYTRTIERIVDTEMVEFSEIKVTADPSISYYIDVFIRDERDSHEQYYGRFTDSTTIAESKFRFDLTKHTVVERNRVKKYVLILKVVISQNSNSLPLQISDGICSHNTRISHLNITTVTVDTIRFDYSDFYNLYYSNSAGTRIDRGDFSNNVPVDATNEAFVKFSNIPIPDYADIIHIIRLDVDSYQKFQYVNIVVTISDKNNLTATFTLKNIQGFGNTYFSDPIWLDISELVLERPFKLEYRVNFIKIAEGGKMHFNDYSDPDLIFYHKIKPQQITIQPLKDIMEAVQQKTDLLTFNNNNVNSNIIEVKGTEVTSVDDFKGSGGGAVDLSSLDSKFKEIKDDTENIALIKTKTDDIQFTASKDIKATLDGEETSANIKKVNDVVVTSVDDFKGSGGSGGSVDLSSFDSKFKQISDQTDKMQFTGGHIDAELVGVQKQQLSGLTYEVGLVWKEVKSDILIPDTVTTKVSKTYTFNFQRETDVTMMEVSNVLVTHVLPISYDVVVSIIGFKSYIYNGTNSHKYINGLGLSDAKIRHNFTEFPSYDFFRVEIKIDVSDNTDDNLISLSGVVLKQYEPIVSFNDRLEKTESFTISDTSRYEYVNKSVNSIDDITLELIDSASLSSVPSTLSESRPKFKPISLSIKTHAQYVAFRNIHIPASADIIFFEGVDKGTSVYRINHVFFSLYVIDKNGKYILRHASTTNEDVSFHTALNRMWIDLDELKLERPYKCTLIIGMGANDDIYSSSITLYIQGIQFYKKLIEDHLGASTLIDMMEQVREKTNLLTFNNNNINSNIIEVKGTEVTSVDDFKGSGGGSVDLSSLDSKFKEIKDDTENIALIKIKTDDIQFTASKDIKATLDGEETSANIKKVNDVSVTNVDDFKGSGGGSVDLSSLDSKFKQITDQTDQITFTDSSVNAQLVGTQKEQLSGLTLEGGLIWEAVKRESLFNPSESTIVSKDYEITREVVANTEMVEISGVKITADASISYHIDVYIRDEDDTYEIYYGRFTDGEKIEQRRFRFDLTKFHDIDGIYLFENYIKKYVFVFKVVISQNPNSLPLVLSDGIIAHYTRVSHFKITTTFVHYVVFTTNNTSTFTYSDSEGGSLKSDDWAYNIPVHPSNKAFVKFSNIDIPDFVDILDFPQLYANKIQNLKDIDIIVTITDANGDTRTLTLKNAENNQPFAAVNILSKPILLDVSELGLTRPFKCEYRVNFIKLISDVIMRFSVIGLYLRFYHKLIKEHLSIQPITDIMEAIQGKTDLLTFNNNNVNSNIIEVKGTEVTSVDDFKGSGGSGGSVDLTSLDPKFKEIKDETDKIASIKTSTDGLSGQTIILSDLESKIAAVKTNTDSIPSIKTKTDDIQFTSSKDIKATLDGEETSANIKKVNDVVVTSVDNFKATTTNVDLSTLDNKFSEIKTNTDSIPSIKTKTDDIQFTSDKDIKATLDGEETCADIKKVRGVAVNSVEDFKGKGESTTTTTDEGDYL